MSLFVTRFVLIFLGRILETFHMSGIPTLGTSIFTCMGLFGIKLLLVMVALVVAHLYTTSDWVVLSWKIVSSDACMLGGLCIDVSLNWFEPLMDHLQLVWCDVQLLLLPPFSLQAAWLYLQEMYQDLHYYHWWFFDTNSSSFKKNQNMSWCKMFTVSGGYLARHTWACTASYHSSTDLLPW